jgi:hypothetical protein
MAGTFQKRQKEMKRREKRQEKEARRAQKKLEKRDKTPGADESVPTVVDSAIETPEIDTHQQS